MTPRRFAPATHPCVPARRVRSHRDLRSSRPARRRRNRPERSRQPATPSSRRTGAALNSFWMPSRALRTFASWAGWLTCQSFCGARRIRAPFAPPRLSEPRNVEADAQAVETSSGIDRPEARILALRLAMSVRVDQLMIDCGHRVLPDQFLCRHLRAEIARAGAHIAVDQLEPGPGEGICQLVRVLVEAPGDLFVDRVEPSRQGPWSACLARRRFDGSWASGTVPAPAPSFGCH